MLAANSKFSNTMYGPGRPLVAVGARGLQVPGNMQPGRALGVEANSEEFLFLFWEHHRELSSSSVFVRRDLQLSCFSWKLVGEPICRTLAGRDAGGGSFRASRQAWAGWPLGGNSPQTPEKGPPATGCPLLAKPDRAEGAGPVAVVPGMGARTPLLCFPCVLCRLQGSCSVRGKWSNVGAGGSGQMAELFILSGLQEVLILGLCLQQGKTGHVLS